MNPELTRATFSYSAEPNLRSVLRKDSKIPLNNCGGESSLYSTQGLVTDESRYMSSAIEHTLRCDDMSDLALRGRL